MGWLVLPLAMIMMVMGVQVGSFVGTLLSFALVALTAPPFWKMVKEKGGNTFAPIRWVGAVLAAVAAMVANGAAYSETPAGKAASAQRQTKEQSKKGEENAEAAARKAADEAKLASGEHCLSGWDGSFPKLKEAVTVSLRNPNSFEHVETVRSPVNAKGKFGLIMTYRAENGFGGVNVEAVAVEVEAKTCDFRRASNAEMGRYLRP